MHHTYHIIGLVMAFMVNVSVYTFTYREITGFLNIGNLCMTLSHSACNSYDDLSVLIRNDEFASSLDTLHIVM